jgi:hypothetical protein
MDGACLRARRCGRCRCYMGARYLGAEISGHQIHDRFIVERGCAQAVESDRRSGFELPPDGCHDSWSVERHDIISGRKSTQAVYVYVRRDWMSRPWRRAQYFWRPNLDETLFESRMRDKHSFARANLCDQKDLRRHSRSDTLGNLHRDSIAGRTEDFRAVEYWFHPGRFRVAAMIYAWRQAPLDQWFLEIRAVEGLETPRLVGNVF